MEQRRARGMLAAAAVIFGTLAPFVRGISVSSGELALYRAVMAALLVGGYLLVSGQKLALRANRREAALLLLSGMAMGMNWILLFEAYRYTTVSVATLSYYFAPVLVTAACPLLFHERLTGKQIVCFVMSTLGLVLVIGVGGFRGGADVRGVLFGLGAAAFYAAVILLNKFIRSVAGIQRTFLQFLAAIVILIPYVAATGGVSLGTLDARGRDRAGVDDVGIGWRLKIHQFVPAGGQLLLHRLRLVLIHLAAQGVNTDLHAFSLLFVVFPHIIIPCFRLIASAKKGMLCYDLSRPCRHHARRA